MAKRGYKKQMSLPFKLDLMTNLFEQFRPDLDKCHQLQDAPRSTSGNCFDWWRSRYSEWLASKRGTIPFSEYSEMDKLFPLIWERFEREFTRSNYCRGVPNRAFDND